MQNEVIADTGFIVAVAIQTDRRHNDCVSVYQQFKRIYVPQSTLAETAYLLTRAGGNRSVVHFLHYLPASKYVTVPLEDQDFVRTAEILDQYADARLDFVDASIAAVAERLEITRILTLDKRDFQIFRPKHITFFELLP